MNMFECELINRLEFFFFLRVVVILQIDTKILLITCEVSDYIWQSEEQVFGFKSPLIVQGSVLAIYFCTTQL